MENNFCKRVSLLTLGLLLTYISVFAQIHLQIFVKDSKQQAVERAEVSVQYGDSIVDFGITAKGVLLLCLRLAFTTYRHLVWDTLL